MPIALRELILPIGACLAIILPFLIFGASVESWTSKWVQEAAPGVLGGLAFGMLALDGLLPAPSSLVSLAVAGALGTWVGAGIVWFGMTVGCAVSWALGRGILGPIDKWVGGGRTAPEWGWLALVALRPVPVLAEVSVLMAAARGMGFVRLMSLTALANLPVAFLYGYFGSRFLGNVPMVYLLSGVGLATLFAVGFTLWRK